MFKLIIIPILLVHVVSCAEIPKHFLSPEPRDFEDRIVGGTVTNIGTVPYQVSMQIKSGSIFYHICGGSIVTSRYILTAAHCVNDNLSATYGIRAGSNYTTSGGQFLTVSNISVHPSYDRNTMDNDVAVLKMSSTLTFNSNVQSISLAPFGSTTSTSVLGVVSGWGTTSYGGTALSVLLLSVKVPVVSDNTCRSSYPLIITPNMFCAGNITKGGIDSCQGDSGGPLAQNGILTGVVSWGYQCALPGYPGVYARVGTLQSWIQTKLV